jgi:hypothetical protein
MFGDIWNIELKLYRVAAYQSMFAVSTQARAQVYVQWIHLAVYTPESSCLQSRHSRDKKDYALLKLNKTAMYV